MLASRRLAWLPFFACQQTRQLDSLQESKAIQPNPLNPMCEKVMQQIGTHQQQRCKCPVLNHVMPGVGKHVMASHHDSDAWSWSSQPSSTPIQFA